MVPNSQGYESYVVVDVEKYDIYTECEKIDKWKYDDRLMLVATKKQKVAMKTHSKIMFVSGVGFQYI